MITASFWWYGWQTGKLVYQQNSKTGRLLVDQVMLTEHWRAMELNKQFLPFVESMTKNLGKQKYKVDMIRPNAAAGSPDAPQDKFEWDLRERFLKAKPAADTPESDGRLLPGGKEYQYYQPIG